jgi:hypothetical protein
MVTDAPDVSIVRCLFIGAPGISSRVWTRLARAGNELARSSEGERLELG